MIDRQEIKQALPHGGIRKIAQRAKVSDCTVSNWFKGLYNSEKVEVAAVEMYAEIQAARKARQAMFEAAKQGEKL